MKPGSDGDAARLEWLTRHVSGAALRAVGVVWPAWSLDNARQAIDEAMRLSGRVQVFGFPVEADRRMPPDCIECRDPRAMHPDCTAPDCDCEPGIECAARGAARGRHG